MTHPYTHNERGEVLPFVPDSAKHVLDVGCSWGAFCRALKDKRPDIEVWGVEINADAASRALSSADRIVTGSFPSAMPSSAPRFDAILFTDVLEHMVDPWKVLRLTKPMLSPTGVVIATIPNARNWRLLYELIVKKNFTYTEHGLFDRTHLRWFTRSTIIDMFRCTGYIIEDCTPANLDSRWQVRAFARLFPDPRDVRALHYITVARPNVKTSEAAVQ